MNDDDTYTPDSPPDTPDPYDYGPDPALGVPHPDPRVRDRAADAALDDWLTARERAYERRMQG